MSEWKRQKKEINSYNLFLTAITGSNTTPGLSDHGIRLVDPFLELEDSHNDVTVDPDFTLYNKETLLLIEIKSGENISQSHITQMDRYSQVSLEAAENFLADTDVSDVSSLERVEFSIVYREDFIEQCRNEWENCAEMLVQVEDKCPVLTQKKGSRLQLNSSTSFDDTQLNEVLTDGVDLPKVPRRDILLSENAEKESLAVSICQDIALNNLVGRFAVTPIEIRNFYGQRPNLDLDRIRRTLNYLHHIGACSVEDGEYVFTEHHEDEIIGIESNVREKRVEEALSDIEEEQAGLADFM